MQFKPGSKVKVFEAYEDGGVSDRVLYEAAIVQGNYPLLCIGESYTEAMVESYGVLVLKENGEPDFTTCWIEGEEMVLLDSDLAAGFELLAQYQAANVGGEDEEEDFSETDEAEEEGDFEDEEDDEEDDSEDDEDEDDEDEEEFESESGPAQLVRIRIGGELKAMYPAESLFVAANTLKLHVTRSPIMDKIAALFVQAPESKYEHADRDLATYIPEHAAPMLTLTRDEIIEFNLKMIAFNDNRNNFERCRFLDLTTGDDGQSLLDALPKVPSSAFESPHSVIGDLSELLMELAEDDGLLPGSEITMEFEPVIGDLQEWFFFGFDEDEEEDDEDEDDFEDEDEGYTSKEVDLIERLDALSREQLERVCEIVAVAHKGFTDKKIGERLVLLARKLPTTCQLILDTVAAEEKTTF